MTKTPQIGEVTSEGANLTDYIVDPELDGVNIDKDGDGQPGLKGEPDEFKEPEGEVPTPKEDEKKRVKAEEAALKKVKDKAEEERCKVIAKESLKERAEAKEAEKKKAEVVVPEVVKETKEEAATRYKEILVNIGFVLQKAREEGKVQYVLEYGELKIGRTFSAAFPTGKFWARKDDKFLDPADVKEIAIVKEFYAVRDGKKEITEVVKETTEIASTEKTGPASTVNPEPYKKGQEIKRQIGSVKLVKKGGYYQVAGHKEPDAALVQQWANELGVSFRVIVAEQNSESAKAVVRAEKDGQFIESVVIHYFKTSRDVLSLEVIEGMQRRHQNPIEGYREDGRPILSQETNYRIYKRVIRFMNFAIRDAITKAARIAALKILNKEWRSTEEIDAEIAEVQSINKE